MIHVLRERPIILCALKTMPRGCTGRGKYETEPGKAKIMDPLVAQAQYSSPGSKTMIEARKELRAEGKNVPPPR